MACVMRSTYLSFCPTVFSSPVEKERVQVFWLFLRVVPCVSSSFFFCSIFDNTPLCLVFPLWRGRGRRLCVFSFRNILVIPCAASFVIPYRESVCLFVGGAGVGFHTMFLLCLVSVFLLLAALCTFVFSCAVRPFGAFPRIL